MASFLVTIRARANNAFLSCAQAATNRVVDTWAHDDGSGRQRWIIASSPDGPNTYVVTVAGGRPAGAFDTLSVSSAGQVDLWSNDDGSGRQRWRFLPVSVPGQTRNFTISVDNGLIAPTKNFLTVSNTGVVSLAARATTTTTAITQIFQVLDVEPITIPPANGAGLPVLTPQDWTLTNGVLSILISKLHAGAVGQLTCRGQDVVPWYVGKGGSLQSAMTFDTEDAERYNPTEAGNVNDAGGPSSSVWLELRASKTEAYTRSHIAFWMSPGEPVASAGGAPALNTTLLSPIVMSKRISLNYKGSPNLVHYTLSFNVPAERYSFVQFEMLTAYCYKSLCDAVVFQNGTTLAIAGGPNTTLTNVTSAVGCATSAGDLCLVQVCTAASVGGNGPVVQSVATTSPDAVGSNGADSYSKTNSVIQSGSVGNGFKLGAGNWTYEVVLAVGTVAECETALRLVYNDTHASA